MSAETCIVAVKYLEGDWANTVRDIDVCSRRNNVPVVFVDRNPVGVGGLADAINEGFDLATKLHPFLYVWFVTNVRFGPSAIPQLRETMELTGYAAIHPAFRSDHLFLRPRAQGGVAEVPFVEFTAPLIRREVFARYRLDSCMPYIGHDLDWGYRVRKAGFKIGVDYSCTVEHKYNRHLPAVDRITQQRASMRQQTNDSTLRLLMAKYGSEWRSKLCYYGKF